MTQISFRMQRIMATALGVLGVALMLFMITVEDEPGAVPLFMIVVAAAWAIGIRVRAAKA
jgi:glucose uptake protein GlcU